MTNTSTTEPKPSPWHQGERTMQTHLGVAERMEVSGRRVIRDYMPDQHRSFYEQLPFVLVGTVDDDGAAWATVLAGPPGYMKSPDPRTLQINALTEEGDPAATGMKHGDAVGLLGIELHTRRRNRMNGRITTRDEKGFSVSVEHAFGNCPQYILTRQASFDQAASPHAKGEVVRATELDETAVAMIRAADTFFVASYVDIEGDPAKRAVDVSHRGGKPGFVRVEGDLLTIPDFAGNLHFNTLGNFLVNPRAGLVFVDFEGGSVLQLSGRAEVVLDGSEVDSFQGAERLWRFKVEKVVRRSHVLALRFAPGQASPNSLMTGSWEEAEARRKAEALGKTFRPFRVVSVVEESKTLRSFHLEPADEAGLPIFRAGQHLPILLRPKAEEAPILRTYTLSTAPSDGRFRITVKRQGVASLFLHTRVNVGDIIQARSPAGNFTVDAAERRPVVLISGGVGITPMLSMLRHIVYEGLRTRRIRPTWFLHGSRTAAERPFDKELAALVETAGGKIKLVQVLSAPEEGVLKADERSGRIDTALLRSVLPFDDYDFYVCGPAAMTQDLYDGLRDMRIPDDRIHAEAFGPSALKRRQDAGTIARNVLPKAATKPVSVIFSRSNKEARWTPGEGTLLELAEARGLNPEFSCRGGSCGTCKTRVLEGKVTYGAPPSAEVAPDEALLCCAIPAEQDEEGGRLVLDV